VRSRGTDSVCQMATVSVSAGERMVTEDPESLLLLPSGSLKVLPSPPPVSSSSSSFSYRTPIVGACGVRGLEDIPPLVVWAAWRRKEVP